MFGSLKNRVALQDEYECYFLVADLHMLTTQPQKEYIDALRENIYEMVLDYLGRGHRPRKIDHLFAIGHSRCVRDESVF